MVCNTVVQKHKPRLAQDTIPLSPMREWEGGWAARRKEREKDRGEKQFLGPTTPSFARSLRNENSSFAAFEFFSKDLTVQRNMSDAAAANPNNGVVQVLLPNYRVGPEEELQ